MSTTDAPARAPALAEAQGWFSRAEAWLDARGKAAWIVAMILGFILFWPIGLAFLAYMIWSKRMFNGSCGHARNHYRAHGHAFRSSGNTAFDAYKAETLRRLEDEQHAFEEFLKRLREAKDKREFDEFLEDRARQRRAAEASSGDDSTAWA
ncbi:DUF2852 domain-containing protein [Rhodobacterales bacterium HKCCE3408]|nr:DUF2852 domain-containing protein [Rhodobacterales bacterium HKCCE3408]